MYKTEDRNKNTIYTKEIGYSLPESGYLLIVWFFNDM